MQVLDSQKLRFGLFELDPRCGELRKSGVRIKLQGQPIQVLEMLLDKPGQLVTREEIRQRLWAADTFVDFDHNLNTAVKKLRQALGDEADTPRYIETLPKYGYRFIAEVTKDEAASATAGASAEVPPAPAIVLAARESQPVPPTNRTIRNSFIVIGGLIVLLGLFATAWCSRRIGLAPRVSVHSQLSLHSLPATGFAISPDGRYFAYGSGYPTPQLWLKDLQQDTEEPLPGTEAAVDPFWSPDGRFLGFFADGKLKKIALDSRIVTILCRQAPALSSWGKGGTILMSSPEGILSVSSDGGAVQKLPLLPSDTQPRFLPADSRPSFLPDGQHFLIMRVERNYFRRGESGTLYVGTLDGSPPHSLGIQVTGRAEYASGYLLYPTEHGLFAQRFDPSSLRLGGDPTFLIKSEGVEIAFSASENGVLASQFGLGYQTIESEIRIYARDGTPEKDPIAQGSVDDARFSPDGTRLAYDRIVSEARDVWIYDLPRRVNLRLTPGDGNYWLPVWSPDGKRLAHVHGRARIRGVAVRNADGTGTAEVVVQDPDTAVALYHWPRSWSRNDDCLFITATEINGPRKIEVLCLNGDRKLRQLPDPGSTSRSTPMISPNGKWLAYMQWDPHPATDPGGAEIFVEPYPGPGGRIQVSSDGGRYPEWSGDGRELFFLSRNDVVEAAPVLYSGNQIQVGQPRVLFPVPRRVHGGTPFTASPDGRHFAINTSLVSPSNAVNVITNWEATIEKE